MLPRDLSSPLHLGTAQAAPKAPAAPFVMQRGTQLREACKSWACARRFFGTERRLDTGFIIMNESRTITPLRASKISDYQTGQGKKEQKKGLLTLLEKASALRRGGPMMEGGQRGH